MIFKLLSSTLTCIVIVCAFASPAFGISLSCSSGDGGGAASSSESFNLDDSTSLKENLVLGSGSISMDRLAAGTGKNSLKQSLSGTGYSLQNDIDSQGDLHASTSSAASPEAASLGQNVGGTGSMSLNLQGVQGATNAGQEASVADGRLVSAQSLSAGQGISASQSTELAGQGGRVVAGALGKDNVIVANGGFEGYGIMDAHLDSAVLDHASAGGTAALDGVGLLNDDSFKAVSSDDKTRGLGIAGLRVVDGGIGNFNVGILNTNLNARDGVDHASQVAAATATSGGSYSSYALTGYRWNQNDPQVQLYLNPTGTPSGLTPESSQSAISAAANTWDDAVAQNIFADGTTVKIDYSKQVPNIFAGSSADTFSVNGWRNFGNSYLGATAYWTNGQKVNGYYSLTEADTVYNLDYQWTTDLNTAQNTGKLDLQSIAVHELGHSIGMGDLYTLPSSDPRKNDFAQVMNAYDAPQRTLGNGDMTGAQKLYGQPIAPAPDGTVTVYRMYSPSATDHFYTTSLNEYNYAAANYGYSQEGALGYFPSSDIDGTIPLYRMYSPTAKDHFYTTNYNEYSTGAVKSGYQQEGIFSYIYPNIVDGTGMLYRMYSPTSTDHFYTSNFNEYSTSAVKCGYNQEGYLGYVYYSN